MNHVILDIKLQKQIFHNAAGVIPSSVEQEFIYKFDT